MTGDEARRLRLRAQRLDRRAPPGTMLQVVEALCALQAQYPPDPGLALRARVADLTAADVDAARLVQRSVVRTWCQRGSIHLLGAQDLSWQLHAFAVARGAHRWLEQRGLDEQGRAAVTQAAQEVLAAEGPLVRRELVARVGRRTGLDVDHAGAGIVSLAALEGRICFGPFLGAQPAYVALDRWLPRLPEVTPEPAVRYLAGHAPARPQDLARWAGVPLGRARAAWSAAADRLVEVEVDGGVSWVLTSQDPAAPDPSEPVVRLLGGFDPYLLGYDERSFAVDPADQRHIFQAGLIRPAVLVDGRVAGTWRSTVARRGVEVRVLPFAPLPAAVVRGVGEEADDLGRYLGMPASLVVLRHEDGPDRL